MQNGVIVSCTSEISGGIENKYGIYFGINRAVIIVNTYRLNPYGVRSPQGVRNYFFSRNNHTGCGADPSFYSMMLGFFAPCEAAGTKTWPLTSIK
jgi:hypothetical protein